MEARLQAATAAIEAYYGRRLLAVALFGSRVGGHARVDSDWDLLIVLGPEDPIRRGLYREWDEQVAPGIERSLPGISPHFVHLPLAEDGPSSLWLEMSANHEILHDRTGGLAAHLRKDREIAFCGSEDLIPSEFYTQDDAEHAFTDAQWVLEHIASVVRPRDPEAPSTTGCP